MSHIEFALLLRIKGMGLNPVAEYRFHPERKWRFDLALPEHKIAIEAEGGIWTMGRHTRGAGFKKDLEKYNAATVLGWRVLRYCAGMESDVEGDLKAIMEAK